MTYYDIFNDKGVFTIISEKDNGNFSALFGNQTAEQLDKYAMLQFAGKTVVSAINAENKDEMIEAIWKLNADTYKKQLEVLQTAYNVTEPLQSKREITENVADTATDDSTETGANIAFNDTEFSDSERTVNTGTNETNRTRTYTETVTGNGAKSVSDEIMKEFELKKINLQKMIIFAVVREITLDVY